jgi:hypothetical protein
LKRKTKEKKKRIGIQNEEDLKKKVMMSEFGIDGSCNSE